MPQRLPNDSAVSVAGNSCPKGAQYAQSELLYPVRTLTAAVRVANRTDTMVSVKTETPIPKDKMMEAMKILRSTAVQAPASVGDVLLTDVFGSRIIITKAVQ